MSIAASPRFRLLTKRFVVVPRMLLRHPRDKFIIGRNNSIYKPMFSIMGYVVARRV